MPIIDIKALNDGERVEGSLLLLKKQILTTKAGKPYGALKLGNKSGEADAKLWDGAQALLQGLEPGAAVKVSAKVQVYQGRPQLVISSLEADPEADPAQFLPASPVPIDEMRAKLKSFLNSIKNPHLKMVLKGILQKDKAFAAAFEIAPGAKGAHHAYVHGLLEHTLSVAKNADALAKAYPDMLDRDLLLAGAVLHDIGKVDEFTLGPPIDYTVPGRLEGHLSLGVRRLDAWLAANAPDFPADLAQALRHFILSHHGSLEFGSPTLPKTPEAFCLHFADDLDAKLDMMKQAAAQAGPGQAFSPYHRLLERHIYLGGGLEETGPEAEEAVPEEPDPASPGLFDGLANGDKS